MVGPDDLKVSSNLNYSDSLIEAVRVEVMETQNTWRSHPEADKDPPSSALLAMVGGRGRKQVVPHPQDRCVATVLKDVFASCKARLFKVALL